MRICGIDPGLRITGYGIIDAKSGSPELIDAGVLRIPTDWDLPQRLLQISTDLNELFDSSVVQVVAIENLYSHYKHPQTAVLMGHVRGVILQTAAQRELPVREFAATHIKRMLTGNGRASKSQMQQAIAMRFQLPAPPEPPDVADALGIATCAWLSKQDSELQSSVGESS